MNAPLPPSPGAEKPFPFAVELETYKRELLRLLADGNANKYCILLGNQVGGIWDTYKDALQYAYGRFGLGERFAVKRIDPRDVKRLAISQDYPMTTPFRITRRVEFGDTDMAGIVHFANFFRYMEAAETAYLRSLGGSVKLEWEGRAIGFPRVAASCDYLQPAFFEDVLDIEVRIEKIGRKSVTYLFEFSRDGTPLAKGKVTSVCCLTGDYPIQSIEIPTTFRALLEKAEAGR